MKPNSLSPGLMLIHGNRSERLRDLLVEWMKRYPLAPLENEIILVQSNGIAQWLKLALAAHVDAASGEGGCGIAAALDISLPSRFIWQAYRAVLGADAVAEVSPFDKARVVWRLMRVVPALVGREEFEPLRRFIRHDDDRRKRFQLAERIADLFDQYQMYRADWLAKWASGKDVVIDARGQAHALPAEQRWQAALWRALLADVEQSPQDNPNEISSLGGRAAVHEAFMQRASSWPEGKRPAGLPRRIVVFGISSLPRQSLEALAALSRWSQVLMCVPNPCAHYWADIVPDKELLRASHARQTRREGAPAELQPEQLHLHAHPLLASWGKQGRDFIGLLDEFDSAEARESYSPQFASIGQRIDLFEEREADTMLQQLQDDIRDLRPVRESRDHWPEVDPEFDTSIRFHIAHSPQREVEILHDQLLAAFNADPQLRPRDIIVMVPDIETYAPHIQAVFGLFERSDPRYIPFSVADRGQRAADPLLGALEALLGLPQSRFAVSDLLDLLDVPALRRRFGMEESDLPRLRSWIRGANVRWGLHAEQRASLGLPRDQASAAPHTWAFGLRRMLLGYAVGSDAQAWNNIEPFGEVGGLDAALLGPLVRLLDALDHTWRSLREPATVPVWCERLRALRVAFFESDDAEDAYTFARLDNVLQDWLDTCNEAGLDDELPLSVVGDYWLSQLDQGALSQRFFAGAVTFATLMPMRAIPFRHVCLLGMNDGDYPRARVPMDFDLMRGYYRPGDRSRREDDRYLLLEAVLSARDHLYVSWVGRSINDNSERPPSVLIGQLRDHLAQGWRLFDEDASLVNALTVEHRLQPFSADYFNADDEASPLFTYAAEWRASSRPGHAQSDDTPLATLAPLVREEPLTLRELADFLKNPVRQFFRQRLRVSFEVEQMASEDDEPFELDALAIWKLQDELIRAQASILNETGALQEGALEEARETRMAMIRRRGDLATGGFGDIASGKLLEPMDKLFEAWRKEVERWPVAMERDREVRFTIEGATQTLALADWLGNWRADADGREARLIMETRELVSGKAYRYARLTGAWVEHLAANLDGHEVTTVIVSKKGVVEFAPLEVSVARRHMTTLLQVWERGMTRPLPFALESALEWLFKHRIEPAEAHGAARRKYEGDDYNKGEVQKNASLLRAYPHFAALAASGEFVELAEHLLDPLVSTVVKKEKAAKA
ncbi:MULTISPECIES: exodeoxyribonuclease V subunit gamma [unclassified Caballeronia]|uniref:exodeoxyribonuclease V subunit gamma n=1 Tax=unclassified Caballeronia TaxID=2646786 RepID=UPI0028665F63|nr:MULTISPECIES: exodeoxyribonuclease V subunit gamma [unclassified Caballeronia]MDR5773880.1 exodeoxyribonuclease V subunit gamma [Caballeronia sp. LZ002]MDR5849315.1 exodeoxyribonuclease V subunit gamma [Caballeronia sp. LZ003]